MTIYVTADTHFCHGGKNGKDGILQFTERHKYFDNIKEIRKKKILKINGSHL